MKNPVSGLLATLPYASICAIAWGSAASPANAQDVRDAPAGQLGAQPIVVTAQRREQDIQDTPIAVTAISGDDLEGQGISSAGDLQYLVPGLSFGRSTSTQGIATLRGVGAVNISVGGDPGVALYVDGHYVQNSAYVTQDFFDVERVEVLRGPQGTLYGRNAIGGAINVITARPEFRFEGQADAEFTNYDGVRFRGMLNAPLGDVAAIRIAGVREDRDGFVTNVTNGDDLDESHYHALRGSLLLAPVNGLEIIARGYFYNNRPDIPVLVTNPYPDTPVLSGFIPNPYLAPGVGVNPTVNNLRTTRNDGPTNTEEEAHGAALDISYDTGDFTLSSRTAYSRSSNDAFQDTDGSDVVFSDQTVLIDYETVSQELTLNYGSGPWSGVGGLFYYHEDSSVFFNIDTFSFFGLPLPATSSINLSGGLTAESYAIFGQLDGPISGPLEFTLGARYSRDEKSSAENLSFPDFGVLVTDFRQNDSWESFNGRVGLRYHWTDDVMTYVSFANGYKSGGFNVGGTQPSYAPERVNSVEVGFKSLLLDDTVRLNIAAFYNDYQDKQESQIETVQAVLVNAASARVFGFEIEAEIHPIPEFGINLQVSHLNAQYRDFLTVDPFNPAAGPQQLSGNELTYSPDWKFSIGAQYEWDLGSAGSLTFRGNLSFVDDQFARSFNLGIDRLPSHYLGNASVRWEDVDEQYFVEGFVTNIGNTDVIESKLLTASILGPNNNSLVQAPRVYGLRAGVSF